MDSKLMPSHPVCGHHFLPPIPPVEFKLKKDGRSKDGPPPSRARGFTAVAVNGTVFIPKCSYPSATVHGIHWKARHSPDLGSARPRQDHTVSVGPQARHSPDLWSARPRQDHTVSDRLTVFFWDTGLSSFLLLCLGPHLLLKHRIKFVIIDSAAATPRSAADKTGYPISALCAASGKGMPQSETCGSKAAVLGVARHRILVAVSNLNV
ncbi:hypothetical protein B0H16DRAFT_1481648 [Mycena metata]|uniref:Uncharacterized protein n=1 Tax=Mycena metata TaxID=1033252 RepID=A0AAD7GXE4_9AGAR|nr:hypothetical protein B0H16DRAFT_1481648 [Mycena metata]